MFHTTGLTMIRLSVPVLSLLCMPTPGSSSDASGVYRHEKGSKRLVSLQAMSPTTERRYTAPSPDFTRYKLL
jgi:hypothetical protein